MVNELMSKRDSIEEVDGNRFEAFAKTPLDSRLPIQIVTREGQPAPLVDAEDSAAEDEAGEEEAATTDLSKGIFAAKG
jgi:hypothetical protein